MLGILRNYRNIEKHILYFIAAEFCVQLINSAFFLILLIYMQKEGYSDYESAGYVSFRFLGVLLFAFPLGILIKNRYIKPWFLYGCTTLPVFSLLIIYAIDEHIYPLLYVSQAMWGISFLCFQVTSLPYILRNSKIESHTAAISLNYAMYSFAGIATGIFIYMLQALFPKVFDEKLLLQLISIAGLAAVYFTWKLPAKENIPEAKALTLKSFDWLIISKALIPTLLIATGAGLTIPFISIFFYNIHHIDSDVFSLIGAIAALLVAWGAMHVPNIKNRWGYAVAVPSTQAIAVIALAVMATTEWFSEYSFAVYLAIICYLIRQPLMNMAGPMTSEVVMGYVGEKNREIVSALTAAIWSGSWFISSIMFKIMRQNNFAYATVFLITAALYTVGVVWYYLLIRDYNKIESLKLKA